MKALVYHGPGEKAWEAVPDPAIHDTTDAVVRVEATTICGTDLHILRATCRRSQAAGFSATRPSARSRRSDPA
jgi:threonine dehydrogenase-like Zn-dependent dehydrogenase